MLLSQQCSALYTLGTRCRLTLTFYLHFLQAFLYISLHKRVLGCVIAEAIVKVWNDVYNANSMFRSYAGLQGYQVLTDSGEQHCSPSASSFSSWLCRCIYSMVPLNILRIWQPCPCWRPDNEVTGYPCDPERNPVCMTQCALLDLIFLFLQHGSSACWVGHKQTMGIGILQTKGSCLKTTRCS